MDAEKHGEACKKWRANNLEKAKAISRTWYHKHKKKHAELVRNYRHTEAGKLSFLKSQFKYFGKKLGIPVDTLDSLVAELETRIQ